jgi:hypothetical protein
MGPRLFSNAVLMGLDMKGVGGGCMVAAIMPIEARHSR